MANTNRSLVKKETAQMLRDVQPLVAKGAKLAKKIAKANKAKGMATISQVPVPTATATRTIASAPSYQNLANGNVVMSCTQFLDEFLPNSADFGGLEYLVDPKAYRVWEFKVNPLETFIPSIAQKAVGFERFKVKKFHLQFHTTLPSATTSGKIAMTYLGDPSIALPADFTKFSSLPGAKSGSVAVPLDMDYGIVIADKNQGEGYPIQQMPDRRSSGDYIEADKPQALLQCPFSVLVSTEGFGDSINSTTNLGRLSFNVVIELIKAKEASTAALSQISGMATFDTEHPTVLPGFGIPRLGPYWRTAPRTMLYEGYTNQKFNFTLDFTTDPTSDPIPLVVLSVVRPDGSNIPVTINDSIEAVAIDGRVIRHLDGVIFITKNDRILFNNTFSWKGAFNIVLTPSDQPLTSLLID